MSVNCLSGTFSAEGKPLIDPEATEGRQAEVVSACVCPAKSDLLLVTQNGQALRLADEDLRVNKSFSLKPIKGVSLEEGDRAVACVPYTKAGVLGITADGFGMLFRGKMDISSHGRGSKGVAFVKLREGDRIVNAVVPDSIVGMLRKDGYFCCAELNQFPERGRNSMGVEAMATDREKRIVAAISFSGVIHHG